MIRDSPNVYCVNFTDQNLNKAVPSSDTGHQMLLTSSHKNRTGNCMQCWSQ